MDAEPAYRDEFPEPSIWPFLAAVTSTGLLVGLIFTPWALPIGAPPVAVTLFGWFWPKRRAEQRAGERAAAAAGPVSPEARA